MVSVIIEFGIAMADDKAITTTKMAAMPLCITPVWLSVDKNLVKISMNERSCRFG